MSTRPAARSLNYNSSRDVDRFWAKVDKSSECWLWTAGQNSAGYGMFRLGSTKDGSRRQVLAHRFAFRLANDRDPVGVVDHLCRVTLCVRPVHLEDVTHRENLLRGETIPARHAAKVTCPRCGSPYTTKRSNGARYCLPCANRLQNQRYAESHQR